MHNNIILPLEIWDHIIRMKPLLSLYFVSKDLTRLLDYKYEHLSSWIIKTEGVYVTDLWIPLDKKPHLICQYVNKFDYQSITRSDLFSQLQLRYVRKPECISSKITISNKKNKKFVKINFSHDVRFKANFQIDSNISDIISGRHNQYYNWISNIDQTDNLNIPELLDELYPLFL